MALFDSTWYLNSVGYAAVTARPQNTAVAAGVLRRQFTAPAAGSERVFVCIVAGTTANVTDATWVLTRGAKTTDGTATWQECTGASAVNGDLANTPNWTTVKAGGGPSLGAIIKRNNGASYQICTTASPTQAASEPAFSDTAGTTTTDGSAVWTSLGAVGGFSGGGAPHARLGAATTATWAAAGNTVYVGDNHAETQAATYAIGTPGSSTGLITRIICNNHSGSYPPTASDIITGASISTSGNFGITLTTSGSLYVYGVTFKAGVGSAGTALLSLQQGTALNQCWAYYDTCSFQSASTATNVIQFGSESGGVNVTTLNNCTVFFGSTASNLRVSDVGQFRWQNTGQVLFSGSSVPTALFGAPNTTAVDHNIVLEALDLSQLTGSLWTVAGGNLSTAGTFLAKDCKLNAATTVSTPGHTGMAVQLARCDSGATAYKSSRYVYEGTETTEATITRVGGAVDPTGQAQSRKIVTTANAQWLRPFEAEPYAIWNVTAGASVTVTVCGTINSASLPNNDEIWIELNYLGSSAAPLSTIVTTTKDNVWDSNAAVASDSSSWNGGGSGGGWSPFKLTKTITPQMAGYIDARVRAAKASATYYIDPKIDLT